MYLIYNYQEHCVEVLIYNKHIKNKSTSWIMLRNRVVRIIITIKLIKHVDTSYVVNFQDYKHAH